MKTYYLKSPQYSLVQNLFFMKYAQSPLWYLWPSPHEDPHKWDVSFCKKCDVCFPSFSLTLFKRNPTNVIFLVVSYVESNLVEVPWRIIGCYSKISNFCSIFKLFQKVNYLKLDSKTLHCMEKKKPQVFLF